MFEMIRKRLPSRSDEGFTLMEIMLVFAIIAVLSTLSLPTMRGFAASQRLKTSAQAIADTLSFARDMAITERTTYLVVFDLDGNRYWLASSEGFDVQNPVASAGRTDSSTVAANGQVAVSRTSGIMGIPQSLSQGVEFAFLVSTHNGVAQQIVSGANYVYFTPTSTSVDTVVYMRNLRGSAIGIVVEATTGRASIHNISAAQRQALGLNDTM